MPNNKYSHGFQRFIQERPMVTIPLDVYEHLVRMAERAEILERYVSGVTYSPDGKIIMEILGKKTENGGDDE